MVRRRQEQNTRELIAIVEQLTVRVYAHSRRRLGHRTPPPPRGSFVSASKQTTRTPQPNQSPEQVYRLLVEQACEHVAVLAPDASAALLFANTPLARRLLGAAAPYAAEAEEAEAGEAGTVASSSGTAGSEEEEDGDGSGKGFAPALDPQQARQQRRLQQLLGK
jgi:hypothetical protein